MSARRDYLSQMEAMSQEQVIAELRVSLDIFTGRLQERDQTIQRLRDELNNHKEMIGWLEDKAKDLNADCEDLEEDAMTGVSLIAALEHRVTELAGEVASRDNAMSVERAEAKRHIEALSDDLIFKGDAILQLNAENDKLAAEVESMKHGEVSDGETLQESSNAIIVLSTTIAQMDAENERLYEEGKRYQAETAGFCEALKDARAEAELHRQASENMTGALKASMAETARLRGIIAAKDWSPRGGPTGE